MRCVYCYRRLLPARACPLHPGVTAPPEAGEDLAPPIVAGIGPLALVGHGGMAVVWRGLRGETEVAVKVAREGGEDRLAREAEALRRLGPPAAPAFVAEARTAGGAACLVMELVGGTTLADILAAREEPAMPPAEVVALVGAIAAALAPVSAAGWVHRDLKPENVFLVPGGGARLIDFGLARPVAAVLPEHDPALTQTGQRIGTATYMAPEQCRSARQVDVRADAYALAVMAFELVTGRPPFVGEVAAVIQAHVAKRPPRPSSLAPAAAPLDEPILRGLAKEPGERFAGATELAHALAVALAAAPPSPSPTRRETAALRPVALVGIRTAEPVSRLGGDVVAVAGDRAVLAFAEVSLDVAIRLAARAARALLPLSADGRIVVHAAPLRVRHGARGLMAIGAALSDLDTWWGAEGSGVVLTSEASAAGETGDTPPGAPRPEAIRLHGRDAPVAEATAAAGAAFASETPLLLTVEGDEGMGKTRLLAALADSLGVPVVRLRARPDARPDALLADLLREALSLPEGADAAAVRAAAGDGWPAAALALGAIADDDPAVAPLLAAPGALRHAAAAAAGRGLLRRAASAPLVVALDDAHRADPTTLDALELATLDGRRGRLVVVVAGGALRPGWGERAARAHRLALPPLDADAARAMLFELLHPVEFIADALVSRIVEATGGVPGLLVELARAMWDSGAVRHHPGTGWHVAADEFLGGSGVPLAQRLLERSLAALPPSVAEIAKVCAAFGEGFRAGDVAAVLPPEVEADAGVAIARLARAGILERSGDRYRFRHPLVQTAIEVRTPPAARRTLAAAILARVLATDPGDVAAVARHASRAGDDARAAAAHLRLADEARRRHRYLDAEQGYGAALANTIDATARRLLLARRGEARLRLHRFADALADFRAARALGAPPAETAELLLHEAIVLDWMTDFVGSGEAAAQAAALAPPALALRCDLALGRSCFRAERLPEAIDLLARVADHPDADYESRVVALTLLGVALALARRLEAAERRFAELVAVAERAGDTFHLAVAYANRQFLWTEKNDLPRLREDTEVAVALARELGHATLERRATYNLAEACHWEGAFEEADRLARRARHLQLQALGAVPDPWEALLLARIACARGQPMQARENLEWIRAHCAPAALSPLQRTLFRACELAASGGTAEEWDVVLREVAKGALQREYQEVLRLAGRR